MGDETMGAATAADAEMEGAGTMGAALAAADASLCLRKTSSLASMEAEEEDVRLLRMHTHSGQRRPPREKYER